MLNSPLTCHCKPLLQLLPRQESLPQSAVRNDTLHSHPEMRRWRSERWRTGRRKGGEEEDVIEEEYTMEEDVGGNRNRSKFLLNVCCISS